MVKRKMIAILLCLCMLAALSSASAIGWDGGTATEFAGGKGTAEEPYLIETPQQLAFMAERVNAEDENYLAAHYLLTADIDLNHALWKAIGTGINTGFQGVFDGGYHVIYGAGGTPTTYEESTGYHALFYKVSGGTVKNVTLIGEVEGGVPAGLVSQNDHGAILNCMVNCQVMGGATKGGAGGIVYENYGGTIANCVSLGHTSAGGGAGGIVLSNSGGGKVSNCYAVSSSGNKMRVNGVNSNEKGIAEHCYMKYTEDWVAHYGGGENGPVFVGPSTGCATFTDEQGLLIPVDGSDPDDLPDDIIGGSVTLVDALNAWVDTQDEGVYSHWVQPYPDTYPVLSGFLTEAEGAQVGDMSHFASTGAYPGYGDVSEGAWYGTEHEGSVRDVTALGLFAGDGKGAFRPDDGIRLCEVLKIAAVMHNNYYGGQYRFDQSTGGSWWSTYYCYAVTRGMILPTEFPDLNQYATRAQMAYILARALPRQELSPRSSLTPADYTDENAYGPEVFLLYRAGVLKGSDAEGTFHGDTGISRAEAAAIVVRLAQPLKRLNNLG